MKRNSLSVRIESPKLALIALVLASLLVAGRAGNPYTGQPEFGMHSAAVLLSTRDSVVSQVQLALRQRGYYAFAIDGFLGFHTQIAIQTFEVDHCYRPAPLVTPRLLILLGITREANPPAPYRRKNWL